MTGTEPAIAFDPVQEEEYRQELSKKLKNRRWRLDHLYKIINKDGVEIDFKMNMVQKILYLGLWYLNLILKSRQHGITTQACIIFLDTCLFNSNIQAAIIAHNKEDAEDFFHRNIKHAYDNLPNSIRSEIHSDRSSSRMLRFSNGSSLRVTTSGRSGTYQLLHISEYGKICAKYPEKAREIKTGSLNTVHPGNYVIIESTAEGREGDFYQMTKVAQAARQSNSFLTKMDYKFFFFAWYENAFNRLNPKGVIFLEYQTKYFNELRDKHGVKLDLWQKAWYVKKWNVQGDDMKREHPSTWIEAFEAAIMGTFYATQFIRIREQGRITKVPYTPGILVDTWWDIGMDDTTAIWFTQDVGREIHLIDYHEDSGEGLDHYKHNILDAWTLEKGYHYGVHGAPHDINVREWGNSGKRRIDSAAGLGLQFSIAPKLSKESGIEQVRQILGICVFDEVNTSKRYMKKDVGLNSLESYRKEWNEALGSYRTTPLHDWSSNGADALRTMATLHRFRATFELGGTNVMSGGQNRGTDRRNPGGWT